MFKRSVRTRLLLLGIPALCVTAIGISQTGGDHKTVTNKPKASIQPLTEDTTVTQPAQPQGSDSQSSSVSVNVSSNHQTQNGKPTVTVNGQNVDVPDNGTLNRSIQPDDGNSHITVNIQNDSSASSNSFSSSVVSVDGNSTSTSDNE